MYLTCLIRNLKLYKQKINSMYKVYYTLFKQNSVVIMIESNKKGESF